ncbi:hypothetical protein Curi_c08710 [Gottschalkia acidurici 9a]|uniref:TM2 domain-containing protein n=1 Tax=Gottschalkia acidurici (strain ATCC 7906 / DSM 604 / BCRC 14475 / CIP 104303 / KCTC 5404 / NCIMB 10678 / 9a) TaxID=1128398 RepID=K0B004_GOTA9|nr:hypothetical protein [Gottschalkia acidurici]AFS77941.1 hypothetical protein Curi_c08710 [Gottschalkia acidurici 9a]
MNNDFYDDEDFDFHDNKKYNKILAMICSLIPGGGHMYLGLMKKGLQFMFLFFGVIVITDLIYSARSFTILNIMIWFYAFFDAYHTRKKLESGSEVEEDLFSEFHLGEVKPKYIGIGFVGLGCILLIQQSLIEILSLGIIIIPNHIKVAILDSIFPIVLILIGFIILRKTKTKE